MIITIADPISYIQAVSPGTPVALNPFRIPQFSVNATILNKWKEYLCAAHTLDKPYDLATQLSAIDNSDRQTVAKASPAGALYCVYKDFGYNASWTATTHRTVDGNRRHTLDYVVKGGRETVRSTDLLGDYFINWLITGREPHYSSTKGWVYDEDTTALTTRLNTVLRNCTTAREVLSWMDAYLVEAH